MKYGSKYDIENPKKKCRLLTHKMPGLIKDHGMKKSWKKLLRAGFNPATYGFLTNVNTIHHSINRVVEANIIMKVVNVTLLL